MIISDRNKLKSWLEQNNYFENGFISKIVHGSIGLVISVGISKKNYVVREPMTIKEFDLLPQDIKKIAF